MAHLKFYYFCKAKNAFRRYAKWRTEDWARTFSEEKQLGQVVYYNDRFVLIPQKLESIMECRADFFSDRMIYHSDWFSLPLLARKDPDFDDAADYFSFAVGRLSELGYAELAMDMMHQAHQAGFDQQPAKIFRL